MNKIQYSCVLTYPTPFLIAYNTTGMMHLKIKSGVSHRVLGGAFSRRTWAEEAREYKSEIVKYTYVICCEWMWLVQEEVLC